MLATARPSCIFLVTGYRLDEMANKTRVPVRVYLRRFTVSYDSMCECWRRDVGRLLPVHRVKESCKPTRN